MLFLLIASACNKEDNSTLPTVETTSVSDVTSSTAKLIIKVTDEGSDIVNGTGVCWGTTINPDLTNNVSNVGAGSGEFTSILTGLTPNTIYYVRAFATNKAGTSDGSNLSFTTLP
jgi:hypothetical protein